MSQDRAVACLRFTIWCGAAGTFLADTVGFIHDDAVILPAVVGLLAGVAVAGAILSYRGCR